MNLTITYQYDANGNRTAVTDENGNTTSYSYDERNRLTKITDAINGITSYEYDAMDRMIRKTDADNKITRYEYDVVGNLTKVTDANGGVVTYTYDANGNRLTMVEPNGNVTNYTYDVLNRLIVKKEPPINPYSSPNQYTYSYDAVGNLISMTDAKNNSTGYTYDLMNRLTRITYPDSSYVSFGYDNNGNRTSMTGSAGTTTYQYNALNRLSNYIDPFVKTVGYGYDSNGNRTSITYPDGKVVQYGYDNRDRLVSVTDWLNRTTTYSYDSASRMTGTVNPNGTTVSYSYDNANRLNGLINRRSNSTVISSYSYVLDAMGNHMQSAETEPLLPTIPAHTTDYAYDGENRMTSAGGVSYGYDNNGNLTSRGGDTFSYDYRDKLIQSSIAGRSTQYIYDGAGNRLAKTEDGATMRYVLDVNSSLPNVIAETDGNGVISAYYVYGLGLISKIMADGTTYYYHYDSRGSAIALTDAGQNITDAYAYDLFGKVVNSTGSTPNPFRYVGRYGLMDEGNGLTYIRARYYAPELGRFITKDPLTGKDGDSQSLNRYVYGVNNPVIFQDLNGLSPKRLNIPNNAYIKTMYCIGFFCEERIFGRNSQGVGYFTSTLKVGFGFSAQAGFGKNTSVKEGTTHNVDLVDVKVKTGGPSAGFNVKLKNDEGNWNLDSEVEGGIGPVYGNISTDGKAEVGVGYGAYYGAYTNSETIYISNEAAFYDLFQELRPCLRNIVGDCAW